MIEVLLSGGVVAMTEPAEVAAKRVAESAERAAKKAAESTERDGKRAAERQQQAIRDAASTKSTAGVPLTKTPTPKERLEPTRITATDLYRAYDANEVAADHRTKDRGLMSLGRSDTPNSASRMV